MKRLIAILMAISLLSILVIASHQESADTFSDYKQFKVDLQNDDSESWNDCQIENKWGYIDALAKHKCLLGLYYGNQL